MATARAGGRQDKSKIKDPFTTLASLYLPTDIKKAFQIAEKIYKSNILILRALYKLAEYPITPLRYNALLTMQDGDEPDDHLSLTGTEVEEIYRHIYEDSIDINRALIELNLNYYLYSNDFPMLHLPFERRAVCAACLKKAKDKVPKEAKDRAQRLRSARTSLEVALEDLKDVKWVKNKFKAKCPRCKKEETFTTVDVPDRSSYDRVSLGRRSVFRMEIQELEFSGGRRYLYSVSDKTKKKIGANDIFSLAREPMVVLKAVGEKKKIEYYPESVFHFRMPSPIFENESPWAWPLLVSAFQIVFFINTLRRGAEAIAQEHINPKPYIAPAKELNSLLAQIDMADVKEMLKTAYEEAQRDDDAVAVMPMAIHSGIMNQQGRAFMPQQEIGQGTKDLLIGLGIAEGLLSGQGPFAANSIAVRILENGFLSQRDMIQRFLKYINAIIQQHFNLPPCEVSLSDFRKLDDSLHKQRVSEAVSQKYMSVRTLVKELGYDPEEEKTQVQKEIRAETEYQAEMEGLLEEKRAETMAEAEGARAAKGTERMLDEAQKLADGLTVMIDNLINKGYDKKWAMHYVSQYMEQQTARADKEATMARAMEMQDTFMMDRRANATTGLNRADNKRQMHQMMDQAVQDPAAQMLTQEQGSVAGIVQNMMMMNDDDRKRHLDEMEARNPTLHQQVVAMLGNSPPG